LKKSIFIKNRKTFSMKTKLISILFLVSFCYVYAQDQVVSLYPGKAPGSENWTWNETVMKIPGTDVRFVYNVSDPTLTVFKADPAVSTGTAVIVCPGGAFQFLSIDSEGYQVAEWLNKHGITAFVLKYRLSHSLTDNPFQELMEKMPNSEKFNEEIRPIVSMAISDGKAAIAYVRTNADEFGISKNKIGIMGFSAGGTVTTGVAFTYDTESRPDFVAPIYPYVGSFEKPAVPSDAPPMFIAAASDDMFGFQKHCTILYNEWVDAKKQAELHIYGKGGHGFGMTKNNLPVDSWIERFGDWLVMLGY
jgi:acetyl esterase/lipase